MNETGAWVHEVRLLFACRVECSGSRLSRDDMDGCLLPASDVVWCCYAWDVCQQHRGDMDLCLLTCSLTLWCGVMLLSRYCIDVMPLCVTCGCNVRWYGGCLLPASWCGVMLLCTRLIVVLLIAEVDCHDADHVMFEVVKLNLVGLLSVAWWC